MPINELHLYGTLRPKATDVPGLEHQATFQLSGAERGTQQDHVLPLGDEHILSLTLDDGTVWYCDPLRWNPFSPA